MTDQEQSALPFREPPPRPPGAGAGIGVAAISTFFFAALPFVLVVLIWIALTIYALVKAFGGGSDAPNAVAVLLTIVGLVTLLALALAGTIYVVGRSMTPRKRRDRES